MKKILESAGIKAELKQTNMVIVAEVHSPGIIDAEWLRKNCGIDEKAENAVRTAEFSLFDTENFQIVVDPARLRATCKKIEEGVRERRGRFGEKYVKVLEHITYKAIGFNCLWLLESSQSMKGKLTLLLSGEPIAEKDENYGLSYGGILYGHASDHRMRILAEIRNDDVMSLDFNFHFEVKELSTEDISKIAGSYMNMLLRAEELVPIFLK